MGKYIQYIYTVLLVVLVIICSSVLSKVNGGKILGVEGDSNFTNLVTSGDVTVGDDLTVTGDLSLTGELQAARVISGGSVTNASSTLTIARVLTAAEVCDSSVITVNSGAVTTTAAAASLDITMPSSSTLFSDCLTSEGKSISFTFVNASPTAASTTEMIAGSGCESFKSQDTGGADTVPGLGAAKITFTRATDYMGLNATNDCIMTVEPFIYD